MEDRGKTVRNVVKGVRPGVRYTGHDEKRERSKEDNCVGEAMQMQ